MAIALSPQSTARILADLSQKAVTPQRAPSNDELEWTDCDADSLPPDLRQAYDDRAAAMRLARELESKFETALNDRLRGAKLIGVDDTMLCSYRFGKLRCAVTKTATLARPAKAKSEQMFGFKRA